MEARTISSILTLVQNCGKKVNDYYFLYYSLSLAHSTVQSSHGANNCYHNNRRITKINELNQKHDEHIINLRLAKLCKPHDGVKLKEDCRIATTLSRCIALLKEVCNAIEDEIIEWSGFSKKSTRSVIQSLTSLSS